MHILVSLSAQPKMVPCSKRTSDGREGVVRGLLIGSLANRSALDGIDVFPNLGYKKDAFLELSLVSNNFSLLPTNLKQDSSPHLTTMSNNLISNSSIFPRGPGDPSSLSGPAVPMVHVT